MALRDYCEHYGISPSQFPQIAGHYKGGRIIVCGDAACIWNDLLVFRATTANGVGKGGWDVMTVNGLVSVFPGVIHHAYSNSATVLQRWIAARRDDYLGEFGLPWLSHSMQSGTACRWPWHGSGTSGLGAVCTALALGYSEIVLAGMPLDNSPHNGEPPWRQTRIAREADDGEGWRLLRIPMDDTKLVRSMSGRTREWFGEP